MEEKIKFNKSMLIKMAVAVVIFVAFWFATPIEPITQIGMRVLGAFISIVFTLSAVDTIWPSMLALVLLSCTGVCTVNEAVTGSWGNWITYFVMMSFIMTAALNKSGFTDRLVAKFMSIKFFSKTPWTFTLALALLGLILGAFMDQVPTVAFMLAFLNRVYKELGYGPKDAYPHLTNALVCFAVDIGGAMTPISHSLAMLGLGIYEALTGESISLFTYLSFGVPTGVIIFALMMLIARFTAHPDFSNFENFSVDQVLAKQTKMELREKLIAFLFFFTVLMWILPGVLSMFSSAAWVSKYSSLGITFWIIISISLMGFLQINEEPLLNLREVMNGSIVRDEEGNVIKAVPPIDWAIILFVSIMIYLGSAMSAESTGIIEGIKVFLAPITLAVAPWLVVLIISIAAIIMTNLTSNVTTITVMTNVGVALAIASNGAINPAGIAMVTTMCGASAYLLPSSFAAIALLHGDEYSEAKTIYKYAVPTMILSMVIIAFVGYNIGCALMG